MTDQEEPLSVWRLASKSVILGAVMCGVAVALVVGVSWLTRNIGVENSKSQAALSAAQTALRGTQADMTRLEENLQMFERLKQSRFAAVPDRLGLLEALESAAKISPQTALEWELAPQEKLKPLSDDTSGEVVAQLVRVPMKLRVNGVHEEEWLALLARLQSAGAGSFTADNCLYERKTLTQGIAVVPSISVSCQLSWLYVVAEGSTPKPP